MWFLEQKIDLLENFAYCANAFSKQECQQIISLGESLIPKTASTFGGINFDVRRSDVSWILPNDNTVWLFQKMSYLVKEFNSRYFKFDLDGFSEGLQFTKYGINGKYDCHIDKSFNHGIRKLSLVIQLSDPSEYQGGNLSLFFSETPTNIEKGLGYAVAFPSYTLHQVNPVTNGTRYSLVAWLTGPSFK